MTVLKFDPVQFLKYAYGRMWAVRPPARAAMLSWEKDTDPVKYDLAQQRIWQAEVNLKQRDQYFWLLTVLFSRRKESNWSEEHLARCARWAERILDRVNEEFTVEVDDAE